MAKTLQFLLLLAITIGCASSARLLDELEPLLPPANPLPTPVLTDTLPQPDPLPTSGQIPAVPVAPVTTTAPPEDDDTDVPAGGSGSGPTTAAAAATSAPAAVAPPEVGATSAGPAVGTAPAAVAPPEVGATSAGPATGTAPAAGGATSASAGGATAAGGHLGHPTLSFFMHDIVGGTHPTSRMVTGLVASAVSNVAFTKANNNIFPVIGGTPLTSVNVNGILSNNRNNLPYLAGLNGQGATGFTNSQTSTIIQNSGNNNIVAGGTSLPFVAAGQLSGGAATLQKLMFGSITVIDDVLTEVHELGSPVLGRAQGFYLASSLDGNSHTMVMTVIVHGGPGPGGLHVQDTISVFGVHRTATLVSHVAVIGGTGKFENAKGFATVESLPLVDQHTTDGADTIMHVNIYLSE